MSDQRMVRLGPDGKQPDRLPTWAFVAAASGVQAIAALVQLQEPVKTVVFAVTLIGTSLAVVRAYGRPPTWFIGGILTAVALFFLTSPAGAARVDAIIHPPVRQPVVKFAPERFVIISVFLDSEGDGVKAPSEPPIPNVPIELSEPGGWRLRVPNTTGVTTPQQVHAQGSLLVTVCGVSQSHEISAEHASAENALRISVGLSEAARTACLSTSS